MTKYCIFDLETTGKNTKGKDDVIELLAMTVDETGKEIEPRWGSLFNPNVPIVPFIANLTGICMEDVKESPEFCDKMLEIREYFEGKVAVAYNGEAFDFPFLKNEFEKNGFEIIFFDTYDPYKEVRATFKTLKDKKLVTVCDSLGIPFAELHRAEADAVLTKFLTYYLKFNLNLNENVEFQKYLEE